MPPTAPPLLPGARSSQATVAGVGRVLRFGADRPGLAVAIGLVVAVGAVYAQTLWFPFIYVDDQEYVVVNAHVNTGLSAENVGWGFAHAHAANWHPATWVSHMLDCELYGLSPGGHHATNVLLHAAGAVVLFLALRRLTGDLWPSAFVAAAFAMHPLRVESVAWVAERKDVLSGLFFALTLLAYERYVRAPSGGRYLLVASTLALGLMAKPMLVTTPCVLLLLDAWPLRRLGASGAPPLRWVLGEKLPLFALVAGSAVATVFAQSRDAAVVDLGNLPFGVRVGNALVSYVVYLGQTIYPADLALFYPHPGKTLPLVQMIGAAAVLVAVTVAAVALRRRCPALLVGWLWYLGMLVPVIGLVQVGLQAHADRYTYLPQVGLWIALAWGVPWRAIAPRRVLVAVVVAVLVVWAGLSVRQLGHWRSSEAIFTHSLSCTGPSSLLLFWFGNDLVLQERWAEAAERYRQALAIEEDAQAHFWLATALGHLGREAESADHFRRAFELDPALIEFRKTLALAHISTGLWHAQHGRTAEALHHLDAVLALEPQNPVARRNKAIIFFNRGLAAGQAGKPRDASIAFREAIRADPGLGAAHAFLGVSLMEVGEFAAAADAFRAALRIDPSDTRARASLEEAIRRARP